MNHTAAVVERTVVGRTAAERTVAGHIELERTETAERRFVETEHTAAEHTAAGSADTEIVGIDPAGTEIDHIASDCTHQIADLHKIAHFEKNFQHYKNYCSRYYSDYSQRQNCY